MTRVTRRLVAERTGPTSARDRRAAPGEPTGIPARCRIYLRSARRGSPGFRRPLRRRGVEVVAEVDDRADNRRVRGIDVHVAANPLSIFSSWSVAEPTRRSVPRKVARREASSCSVRLTTAAAMGCAVVVALAGCSGSSATAAAARRSQGSTYTLMQMNLCLSGVASCYDRVQYPAVLGEAVARIRETRPNAVTFNEACRGDVALIARRTRYHFRFSAVIYAGKDLPCVRPGGRGLFGDAVLSRASIQSSNSRAFAAQAGPERREWLCVSTRIDVDVCTAHLASPQPEEAVATPRSALS